MSTIQEYKELLKLKGVCLRTLGLSSSSLERADALSAIESLRKASIPILGGDVYLKHGNEIELAYANWHSESKPNEVRQDFVHRSCLEAENYIKSFPSLDGEPLFEVVIDD